MIRKGFLKSKKGQGFVEYALLVLLVAIIGAAIIGVMQGWGQRFNAYVTCVIRVASTGTTTGANIGACSVCFRNDQDPACTGAGS